jgi:uncharacterized protein
MNKRISETLLQIERDHYVRIIYACESGSRAWGFASKNSDFDVRFIYVHPRDWYLTIADKRDVIELPVDALLDVNGWDIRKTLQLLRRSNSPLMEWLSSPMRYSCLDAAVHPLLDLSRKAFLPAASFHHYLSMAKNNLSKAQDSDKPKIKSYLYALRPMLCCKWIKMNGSQPPMLIDALLAAFLPDRSSVIRSRLDEIMRTKKEGLEATEIERSPLIEDYLSGELDDLGLYSPPKVAKEALESFDELFRGMLKLFD